MFHYHTPPPKNGIAPTSRQCVCVVFTLNRSFYPTTSAVHPVSVLILHPREIQIMWSQTVETEKTKTTTMNQGKASEMLAYRVREHNKTSQTRKIRKIRTKKTKKRSTSTYFIHRSTTAVVVPVSLHTTYQVQQ